MTNQGFVLLTRWMLSVVILSSCILVSNAQLAAPSPVPAKASAQTGAQSRYRASRFPKRAGEYYRLVWGVDSLSVKAVESGELIRFNYRLTTRRSRLS